jgi:hypothetical protein
MPASSAARVRQYRERQNQGKCLLLVSIDEDLCLRVLADMGILPADRDHSHLEMARGIGRLLEELGKDRN